MRGTVDAGEGSTATNKQMISQICPKLLWLIRDSAIYFQDENGQQVSENQHFEQKLASFAASSRRHIQNIREAIVNYFEEREMLSMSAPLDEENGNSKGMSTLDKIGLKGLDTKFQDDTVLLFYKVFQETPIKQMQSKAIRGSVLAELLDEYVQALNSGSVPNVSSAWDNYMQKESNELMQAVKEAIERKVNEEAASSQNMPMPIN